MLGAVLSLGRGHQSGPGLPVKPSHSAAVLPSDTSAAGIGGWFQCASGQLRWFHVAIARSDIPDEWRWPQTMQAGIRALELLAQLALVVARAKTSGMPCVRRALL